MITRPRKFTLPAVPFRCVNGNGFAAEALFKLAVAYEHLSAAGSQSAFTHLSDSDFLYRDAEEALVKLGKKFAKKVAPDPKKRFYPMEIASRGVVTFVKRPDNDPCGKLINHHIACADAKDAMLHIKGADKTTAWIHFADDEHIEKVIAEVRVDLREIGVRAYKIIGVFELEMFPPTWRASALFVIFNNPSSAVHAALKSTRLRSAMASGAGGGT